MFDKSYIKLGQIYQYLKDNKNHRHKRIYNFETLIENDFDVNYQLPIDSLVCKRRPDYAGNTALHIIVELYRNNFKAYFDALIKRNADFTLKNNKGYSPLLLAFDKGITVDSLLIAHLSKNNTNNIRSKAGLSHFHVVCTTDYEEIVDFFIKSGVDVNERVNDDSPKYPGYTPLHFAISNLRLQVTKSLISSGADISIKDARGITPLHLVIDNLMKNPKLFIDIEHRKILECIAFNNLHYLPDDIGLTCFHLSCVFVKFQNLLKQIMNQDDDIDQTISFNSPIWPGYTPLHFASHVSLKTVISLLEKGADILAKDANGTMPLDIMLKRSDHLDEIVRVLAIEKRHRLSELKLTNGTYLLDAMQAMVKSNVFKQFLIRNIKAGSAFIPLESPLWPGFNLLHLTVLWGQKYELLSRNTDFTMLDANGMSPLHLAFRMKQRKIVECLLGIYRTVIANPIDRDNLSHLHITCAAGMYSIYTVERMLATKECDPNVATKCDFEWDFHTEGIPNVIRKGSTPLHIAVYRMNTDLMKVLLSRGANPHIPDSTGLTPFQAAISYYNLPIFKETGRPIRYLDTLNKMWEIKGKDMMKSDMGIKTFRLALKTFNGKNNLLSLIFKAFDRENRYEELGLTRLQIGCVICDIAMIIHELEMGEDINKQVAFDSDLWPGDTALHILIRQKSMNKFDILQLMLDNGVKLTLQNASGSTPILLDEYDEDVNCKILGVISDYNLMSHKVTNNEGLTYFHKCCRIDYYSDSCIEKILRSQNNDVNASVDYFSDHCYAGYTGLHFLVDLLLPNRNYFGYLERANCKVLEILLDLDADPKIKAANGLDALHLAVISNLKFDNQNMVKTLLRHPAVNMEATNIFNETILDLITHYSASLGEGSPKDFAKQSNLMYLTTIIENGYELDYKDKEGKTALHKFTCINDCNVVKMLLSLGADINIKDDNGKTAFAYLSTKDTSYKMRKLYVEHIQQLQDARMTVDKLNKIDDDNSKSDRIFNMQIRKQDLNYALKKYVDPSFSVDYLLSEKFVVEYKRLTVAQRKAVQYFYYNDHDCLVQLQCRKARFRTRLFEPAEIAFQSLIGWSIPGPCFEAIFQYLSNDDIMNCMRAGNGILEFAPIPENC